MSEQKIEGIQMNDEKSSKPKFPPKRTDKRKLRCWDCNTDLIQADILHQKWVRVTCALCKQTLFYDGA